MKKEEFRQIEGYEALYSVSDYGRVISHERMVNGGPYGSPRLKQTRILKQRLRNKSYFVKLCKEGVCKDFSVKRLVWEAFIGKIKDKYVIFNKNKNLKNSALDNLVCIRKIDRMLYSEKNKKSSDVKWIYGIKESRSPYLNIRLDNLKVYYRNENIHKLFELRDLIRCFLSNNG